MTTFNPIDSSKKHYTLFPDSEGEVWEVKTLEPWTKTHTNLAREDYPPIPSVVDPADNDTLFYGAMWGIQWATGLSEYPGLVRNDLPSQTETLEGFVQWKPGWEKKAANYLRDRVKEGLLEIAYVSCYHWNFQSVLYGNAKQVSRITEQEQALWNLGYSDSQTKLKMAARTALILERELNAKFEAAGDSFAKTLAVCNQYLEGRLGVDWHVKDFFKLIPTVDRHSDKETFSNRSGQILLRFTFEDFEKIKEEQDSRLEMQALQMENHLKGNPHQHFGNNNLRPLMKRFPDLARIYNLGE